MLFHYMVTRNIAEDKAFEMIMKRYRECRLSCKGNCSEADHVTGVLWRMDDMAPPTAYARTFFLKSVPSKHRIPEEALSDLDTFFANKENVYPKRSYFFEYNPSIARIPDGYTLPEGLPDKPVYIASFRLATTQQCVTGDTELTMFGGSYPYPADDNALGIALLRADLTVIADVAVNMRPMDSIVQDFRVFAFNNQVYLSSHYFMRPIWLVQPMGDNLPEILKLPPKFDDPSPPAFDVYIRRFPSCVKYKEGKRNGKNLNFFKDHDTQDIMMELRPMGSKIRIDLNKRCTHDAADQEPHVDPPPDAVSIPSFRTMEERYFGEILVFKSDRGSACCVTFEDPRNPSGPPLLLGISHAKTLKGQGQADNFENQYASRFYAMESVKPYKVVAMTGRFCLGFPHESENDNPYARLNLRPLVMVEQFDCPRIHFVSGLLEKADDPSKLLIAYGVNDCAPRIMEVSKAYVVRLLFPGRNSVESSPE